MFDKEELLIFLFYINNIIKVLSIKGKEHLGGIDIDNKLCVYYMNIFKRRKYWYSNKYNAKINFWTSKKRLMI